jgi:hypothetical protein
MVRKIKCPKIKLPQQYAIVRLTKDSRKMYQDYLKENKSRTKRNSGIASLLLEEVFIFLGEIPNMRGHVVVAGMKSGKIFSGWHTECFEQLSDEET